MKIDELPRKAVLRYLELARLPLTATERVLGKQEGTWAPTIVVDRLQAKVKDVAATVLKDDGLRADAKLQHAALDERLRATIAEAAADRIRTTADDRLAPAAKRDVAARDEQREQTVGREAVAKKAAVRKTAAKREKVVEKRATSATRETPAEESKALNDQRAAAEANAEVLELQDKLDEVEQNRTNGS